MAMLMRFPGGRRKALTLSYDDGRVYDARLADIFNSHGLRSTFFICSGFMRPEDRAYDPAGYLSFSEARRVYEGHEIASHTVTHALIGDMLPAGITDEVLEDRRRIEAETGRLVRGLAYPCGSMSESVFRVLRDNGLSYGRTNITSGGYKLPQDWYQWQFTCRHTDPKVMDYACAFLEDERPFGAASLFYLFGHSYEFPRDDNWQLIEEFAALMGGHADIWYATNAEICDYTKAYRRLCVSVGETRVYNPSAMEVWVNIRGKNYAVAPGETKEIG